MKERVAVLQNSLQNPSKPKPAKPVVAETKPVALPPAVTNPAPIVVAPPVLTPTNTVVATVPPANTNVPAAETTSSNAFFPADTNLEDGAIPAVPALPDSAFEARIVAEQSLPPALRDTTGHVPLLKVSGRRNVKQLTPTFWTFDLFDPKAAGHARIVSVSDHRVVASGERLTYIMSPYTRANILPEDLIDSTQALQIVQQLLPGVAISDSAFVLSQDKNSAPFWTVTVWARNAQDEDVELGDVVLLAEKGDVISNSLKPQRLKD
jgi:hypothetical protein